MTYDTLSLAGKIAIVTGSGRENGIGAAIARALARNGAAVTINHVSESSAPRAAAVARSIVASGGKAIVVKADVGSKQGADIIVSETLKQFATDRIDILVNNAAIGLSALTLDTTEQQLNDVFAANVNGPFLTVQATVPHMPAGGRIVNISSITAKMGMTYSAAYGATKAALDSLTYTWAQEFGKSKGITVNSIAPGPVETDIVAEGVDFQSAAAPLITMTRAADRTGTVQDIADIVLLIANEKSRWITGQHISASGGMTGQ